MPKPYHRNPRQIKKGRFDRLNDTLTRLGDLGGIVHNIRTDEIIGGNQRTAVFGEASEVQIVEQYDTPDEQGTVAHGFVVWQGKKYSYRQVDWNEETAAEANIAANIGAGEWDWSVIANEWQPAELTEWGFDESLLTNWRLDVASLGNFLESEEEIQETVDGISPTQARQTLAERFVVPPFSVLDARQGYWQERKRAWLALGIQSELGRGDNLQGLSEANDEYRYNKNEYLARIGRGPLAGTLGAIAPNEAGADGILTRTGKYAQKQGGG